MKRWPLLMAVILLAGAWGLTRSLSHAELIPLKKPFASFPLTIGQTWQGKELGLERDVLNVLKLDDYMMRVYYKQPEASGSVAGQECCRSGCTSGTTRANEREPPTTRQRIACPGRDGR